MWSQTRPCRSLCGVQVKWAPNSASATVFKWCLWDVSEMLICLSDDNYSFVHFPSAYPNGGCVGNKLRRSFQASLSPTTDSSSSRRIRRWSQDHGSWIWTNQPTNQTASKPPYLSIKWIYYDVLPEPPVNLLTLSWRVSLPRLWRNWFSITLVWFTTHSSSPYVKDKDVER